ncbi:MAG: hypothetical protein JST84_26530 [Acidobacteria bacterium]|nr:hypothetical protein [Acidobacteriota bacterium]
MTETADANAKRGIDGRKFALIFVALALLLSLTAVYLNYHFTQNRGVLQERLQKENQQLIQMLRGRIAFLRLRANGSPEINAKLDVLSKRLDEAAALPPTKYQQVGQACSEVETAVYLMERDAGIPK